MEALILVGVVLVAAGAIAAVRRLLGPVGRMLRALRRLQHAQIARAPDGKPVIIMGTVARAVEPLVAPLSGRRCACYTVVVEERKQNGWKKVLQEMRASDFQVRDESGKALVAMNGSLDERIALAEDRHFVSGSFQRMEPLLAEFLASRGLSSRGVLFERSLRCREGVLEEGELVVVAGAGRWEVDPRPDPADAATIGYRETPRWLVLESSPRLALRVSDSPEVLQAMTRRRG